MQSLSACAPPCAARSNRLNSSERAREGGRGITHATAQLPLSLATTGSRARALPPPLSSSSPREQWGCVLHFQRRGEVFRREARGRGERTRGRATARKRKQSDTGVQMKGPRGEPRGKKEGGRERRGREGAVGGEWAGGTNLHGCCSEHNTRKKVGLGEKRRGNTHVPLKPSGTHMPGIRVAERP